MAFDKVYIASDSRGDVINNTLSNIGGYGVFLSWYTANNKIIGNIISNTSLASIRLVNTGYFHAATISNNTILNSTQQGNPGEETNAYSTALQLICIVRRLITETRV